MPSIRAVRLMLIKDAAVGITMGVTAMAAYQKFYLNPYWAQVDAGIDAAVKADGFNHVRNGGR